MWALTHVKRQSMSVSAFLSPPSQVMMGIRSFSFLETMKSPPSSLCSFAFSYSCWKFYHSLHLVDFPPFPQWLCCSQPYPSWFYYLTHAPPKAHENVLLKHILLTFPDFHNYSLALDFEKNFQTVLQSPAPRFPGLSAAMPCLHLTFRILDHIPNSQAPHLTPEALPELTRTSDLFFPLIKHSHLFSLNYGNSPHVLAKTHTWVQTPWLHLYFLTSQILFLYIHNSINIMVLDV